MKKLFAMMLAAAMCLSLCAPAFASEESRNDIGSTNLLNQPFHIVYTEFIRRTPAMGIFVFYQKMERLSQLLLMKTKVW